MALVIAQDKRKLRNHYLKNGSFKYDLLALLPLDLLYAVYGVQHTILRLPRLLKFGDFQEFFRRLGERGPAGCSGRGLPWPHVSVCVYSHLV